MTLFDALRLHCGLSHGDAAWFLGLNNVKTVAAWCAGRAETPVGVMDELRALNDLIDTTADRLIDHLAAAAADEVVIGYPADDHEALALGLPCVGAWRAMIGRVIAVGDRPIRLVPRGSTPETAAAADQAGR